jgi:hypothetical protein
VFHRHEARHGLQQLVGAVRTVICVNDNAIKTGRKVMCNPFHHKQSLVAHAGDADLFVACINRLRSKLHHQNPYRVQFVRNPPDHLQRSTALPQETIGQKICADGL